MKLVAGLGNPGKQYQDTRHNIGFLVLDSIIRQMDKRECDIIFCKPKTFMNNSGIEIARLVNYYKIEPKDIWIISDDVDLPFGVVRSRFGGSDGGHNGIKSIITHLKTEDINRIRVGIGRDDHKDTADYVLAKFTQNEQKTLTDIVDKTALFVIDLLSRGMRVETHKF